MMYSFSYIPTLKYVTDFHIKPDYAFGDPIRFLTVRF